MIDCGMKWVERWIWNGWRRVGSPRVACGVCEMK